VSSAKLEEWQRECAQNPGRRWRVRAYEGSSVFEMENKGTFDELVVDHWLHVEQMDERVWLVRAGTRGFVVTVNVDGSVSTTETDDSSVPRLK
jgi:hypothetical protein